MWGPEDGGASGRDVISNRDLLGKVKLEEGAGGRAWATQTSGKNTEMAGTVSAKALGYKQLRPQHAAETGSK